MLFLFNPAPENMTPEAWRSVSLATWMVIWWLGEAMPITATALLTATLMPLFGFALIMQANKYMNTVPLNC
jgi:sodium-dependent dicarboxylate transporter 2/3/5